MQNDHLKFFLNFLFLGGILHICFTFLSHFWHKTMTKLLFCVLFICNNSILYLDVSYFEVFSANLDFCYMWRNFSTFTHFFG